MRTMRANRGKVVTAAAAVPASTSCNIVTDTRIISTVDPHPTAWGNPLHPGKVAVMSAVQATGRVAYVVEKVSPTLHPD